MCPIAQQPGQAVVPGRLSVNMCVCAGLGLVQRTELLSGPLHGPRLLRHARRVPHVRGDHEKR
jgi:hypothetical protein